MPGEESMSNTDGLFERMREKYKGQAQKDRETFCHEATTFKGMVTDLLNPVAEGWTELEQLDKALAVLDQMATQWKERTPRGHFPSLGGSHRCVEEVYQEARLRLEAIKQLGLRQKIW